MSEVNDLMYEITHLNTEPAVFRVSLSATDHSFGYNADAIFRQPANLEQNITCLTASGETPEDALRSLRDELIRKYESTSSLRERVAKMQAVLKRLSDSGYLEDLPTSILEEVETSLNR